MQQVVVLGTGVVAYGVFHECREAGYRVIHVTTKADDIAAASTLPHEKVVIDAGDDVGAELLNLFLNKKEEWTGAFIIPVNDPPVAFVSKYFEALSAHYVCNVIPWNQLGQIVNKNRLYQHAHDIGVLAPQIQLPGNGGDLSRVANDISYPCIIKPFQTPAFFAAFSRKVHVANDFEELGYWYKQCLDRGIDVMVSEIIPGPEEDLFIYDSCLDASGNVTAEIFLRKVRQDVDYGVASVIKTVPEVEEIREMCLRLLRHFNYRGFSAVEVKRDERDGRFKLIEINPRPVLYQRMFIKTGVNVCQTLVEDFVEGKQIAKRNGNPGIYWMHNVSEIYALKRHALSPDLSLKDFFRPYFEPHVYALPAFRDRRPLMAILRRTFF